GCVIEVPVIDPPTKQRIAMTYDIAAAVCRCPSSKPAWVVFPLMNDTNVPKVRKPHASTYPATSARQMASVLPLARSLSGCSDRITPPVVFVVLVESALSGGNVGERFHEPDGLHPLHLLESQLELVAQAVRRSMILIQSLAVHLVREDGLGVVHVPDAVNVVVSPAALIRSVREGDEHGELRFGFRADDLHNVA